MHDIARTYADQFVLSALARVSSTLRLRELAQEVAPHGISLSDLQNLLTTNPERYVYEGGRWYPRARMLSREVPFNQFLRTVLELYGGPMPVGDLASECAQARGKSMEYYIKHLFRTLNNDPDLFCTPSGYAGLAKWLFRAGDESPEVALLLNDVEEEEVANFLGTLGRVDYSELQNAAKRAVRYAPFPFKVIGFFAWRQLNPPDPYELRLYDAVALFDALLCQEELVFGADEMFYPVEEAQKWLKQALRDAGKMEPYYKIEEAPPLELGDAEVEEIVEAIYKSDTSVSVGELLQKRFEIGPGDKTYEEDVNNAVKKLRAIERIWWVGGDRFRAPDTAPPFVHSVPEVLHFPELDFVDESGQAIDVELSDDAFPSALRKELVNPLAQDVLDEEIGPAPRKMPEKVRLVLKAHHREIGTFPLCQFPTGWFLPEPNLQELIFIDAEGRELNVWLNHHARLLFNLFEWWLEQPLESGAVFTLSKTDRPNVFHFEWQEEPDPLLYISSERMEELRDLAGRAGELSTYEIIMEILGKHKKGAEFLTILAEVNVVRRTRRRLVASILTGYHCFYQRSGSPLWHFDAKKIQQGFDRAKKRYIRKGSSGD